MKMRVLLIPFLFVVFNCAVAAEKYEFPIDKESGLIWVGEYGIKPLDVIVYHGKKGATIELTNDRNEILQMRTAEEYVKMTGIKKITVIY